MLAILQTTFCVSCMLLLHSIDLEFIPKDSPQISVSGELGTSIYNRRGVPTEPQKCTLTLNQIIVKSIPEIKPNV